MKKPDDSLEVQTAAKKLAELHNLWRFDEKHEAKPDDPEILKVARHACSGNDWDAFLPESDTPKNMIELAQNIRGKIDFACQFIMGFVARSDANRNENATPKELPGMPWIIQFSARPDKDWKSWIYRSMVPLSLLEDIEQIHRWITLKRPGHSIAFETYVLMPWELHKGKMGNALFNKCRETKVLDHAITLQKIVKSFDDIFIPLIIENEKPQKKKKTISRETLKAKHKKIADMIDAVAPKGLSLKEIVFMLEEQSDNNDPKKREKENKLATNRVCKYFKAGTPLAELGYGHDGDAYKKIR